MTEVTALLPGGFLLALVSVLGLAVGSFLNVVVHRVPAGLSVLSPPSACPGCAHDVRPRDNVPVLSWLWLRGRCRDCAMAIPARYPLVEAGTGAAFAFTAWRIEDPVLLVAALVAVGAGIALALIDLEHQRLPFAVTGVAAVLVALTLVAGLLAGAVVPSPLTLLASILLWAAVYGGLWLVTSGRGMGLGDVALAPVMGAVLAISGLGSSTVGLMAGFLIGTLVLVPLMALGRVGRGAVPHGPFLLAGAAVGLFAGEPLARGYLRLVGLA